jgi:hypothetical protein
LFGSCIIHILNTGLLKFEKNSGTNGLILRFPDQPINPYKNTQLQKEGVPSNWKFSTDKIH